MNEKKVIKKSKKNSQAKEIWRRFRKSKTAMLGLVLLIFVVGIAIFADVIVPYENAIAQDIPNRLQGPSAAHWFGTDEAGRDLFARIVHGSRYSLAIGIITTIVSMIIGGLLGAVAAYYGGWVDNVIMRVTDVIMTVPPILLSLAVVAALGANMLSLRPCIQVKDGKMGVGKKYRGAYQKCLLQYVKERLEGHDDIDLHRIFITESGGFTPEEVAEVEAAVRSYQPFEEVLHTRAGCTVSSHCGPRTLGILYFHTK